MLSWLLAAALAVAPPASPPSPVPAAVPAPEQIMAVPDSLQARLDAALPPRSAPARERLEALLAFMLGDSGMGLHYSADATHTVAQADAAREANCLTYTLVLLALAPRAGLEAYPQEITQTLSWYQQANTVYRNSHVNAVVRVGQVSMVVDVSGNDLIARDAPFPISRERLLSHYYNNLAIRQLAQGDTRGAAVLSERARQLAPEVSDHWSNAGVIHVRNGEPGQAVAAYTRALALDPRNAGALFNAVVLTRKLGDSANETRLRERLEKVQRRDPFHQFLLALELEQRGMLAQAIVHFRQAARLYPREHRFHAALARACQAAGELRCASTALNRARGLARGEVRAGYQAQLEALRAGAARDPDRRGALRAP